MVAEGVGFEPTRLSPGGFQDRCHQPLGHPSAAHSTGPRLPSTRAAPVDHEHAASPREPLLRQSAGTVAIMYTRPRTSRTRRLGSFAMALAVIALAAASLYGTISLVGTALGPAPARTATPGQASQAVAVGGSPSASGSIAILPSGSAGPSGGSPSGSPSIAPSPSPTPKPGPFKMDLYRSGAFVRELTPIWCLSAAMQT